MPYLRSIAGLVVAAVFVSAPTLAEQAKRSFSKTVSTVYELDYLLHLPEGYAEGDSWPLIVFLHGAGERGSDLEVLKKHGPPKLVAAGKDLPAIVVSPQAEAGTWWNDQVGALSALIDEIEAGYAVDSGRIYLTGLSMGGYGTWALAGAEPERFAALAPICGGGMPLLGRRLVEVPIWIFHGDADSVVPVAESERMAAALERFGSEKSKLTIYPGVNHDSWTRTYDDPAFWEWLFAQRRD